jgi:hypothetical protein
MKAKVIGVSFKSWAVAQEWIKKAESELPALLEQNKDKEIKDVHFLDIVIGKEKMYFQKGSDIEHKQYPAKRKNTWFIYFEDLEGKNDNY